MNKNVFDKLTALFNKNHFCLYMVGGATRDYLLGKEINDYDLCTDATPDEMKEFLPDAKYTFAKFGTVNVKIEGVHIDITTLRVEEGYSDFRHPSKIKFTRKLEEDYVRRDFTINALYMDKNYKIIDFCGGIEDLNNKVIRFIGDPDKRINEDPLRILRAERFEKQLGFKIEDKTFQAIQRNRHLIDELNPQKVEAELRKMKK